MKKSDKLEVNVHVYGKFLLVRVLNTPKAFRGTGTDGKFTASNGFTILSAAVPELMHTQLYVHGTNAACDLEVLSVKHNSERDAMERGKAVRSAVDEFNAKWRAPSVPRASAESSGPVAL